MYCPLRTLLMISLASNLLAIDAGAEPRMLVIGDSIDLGFGVDRPYVDLDGWEVTNLSRLGMTTLDWIRYGIPGTNPAQVGGGHLIEEVADDAFHVISIRLGSNDAAGAGELSVIQPRYYEDYLEELVWHVLDLWPDALVLLHHPSQTLHGATHVRVRLSDYRDRLEAVADRTPARLGVDFLPVVGLRRFMDDPHHPDQEGHDRMRAALEERLDRIARWIMRTERRPHIGRRRSRSPG